jgi:hypothetical protein
MNWGAIGAIGEITGAAAVVISLVYLAAQIRIQNRESQLTAKREMSSGFRVATTKLLDSGLAGIFVAAIDDFDGLSDEERLKLFVGVTSIFRAWEEAYIQHETGHLDARSWQPMLSYYSFILSSPSAYRVWERRKQHFDAQFRDFVDGLELPEYSLR